MTGIPVQLAKITIVGKIKSVQDWSTSLWVQVTPTADFLTQANFTAYVSAIENLVNTWWGVVKGYNNVQVDYRGVNGYYYLANSTRADRVASSPRGASGGSSALADQPTYVSGVVSLRSTTPGRSGRGRSYCPTQRVALDSTTLQFPAAMLTAINGSYKTLIDGINAATPAGSGVSKGSVVVASFTKGQAYPVATLIMDSKPDVQRRREDVLDAVLFNTLPVVP